MLRVRVEIMGLVVIRTDRDLPTTLHFCHPIISPRTRIVYSREHLPSAPHGGFTGDPCGFGCGWAPPSGAQASAGSSRSYSPAGQVRPVAPNVRARPGTQELDVDGERAFPHFVRPF
jgi:hypothetical protein